MIDWKTSEKPKPFIRNTFDNPLQLVAYVGAVNHDANYSFQVRTLRLSLKLCLTPVYSYLTPYGPHSVCIPLLTLFLAIIF